MSSLNRRDFLGQANRSALGLAAGVTILSNPRSARATPANDRLVLAMIGVGGNRGNSLAMGFLERGDCEIGYICDVDRRLHEPRAKELRLASRGKRPKCVQDFREMLDDKSVDAVVIATPPTGTPWRPFWAARPARTSTGEAAKPQLLGRPPDGRGRSQVQPHRADRHAEPQRPVQHRRQALPRRGQAGPDPPLPRP